MQINFELMRPIVPEGRHICNRRFQSVGYRVNGRNFVSERQHHLHNMLSLRDKATNFTWQSAD
jgi:hypothetical protein